jgi:hypothetical protein
MRETKGDEMSNHLYEPSRRDPRVKTVVSQGGNFDSRWLAESIT